MIPSETFLKQCFDLNRQTLKLNSVKIKDVGLKSVFDFMAKNRDIIHLDLSFCEITQEGLKQLSTYNMSHLKTLNVQGNQIKDEGLKIIATNMANLERLDFGFNQITDKGLTDLLEMGILEKLQSLNLRFNKITAAGLDLLTEKIGQNLPMLKDLNVSYNKYKIQQAKLFKQSYKKRLDIRNQVDTFLKKESFFKAYPPLAEIVLEYYDTRKLPIEKIQFIVYS